VRLLVVGPSGAGKSRLARAVAARTGCVVISEDELLFDEAWRRRSTGEHRACVVAAAVADHWVFDGDDPPRELWDLATGCLWLDPSPSALVWGLVSRELANGVAHVEPWAGWPAHLRWLAGKTVRALREQRRHRRLGPARSRALATAGASVTRLRTRADVAAWMNHTYQVTRSADQVCGED
jgi:hypothetical protein